jgi:acetolactate synthase I/III small subunit
MGELRWGCAKLVDIVRDRPAIRKGPNLETAGTLPYHILWQRPQGASMQHLLSALVQDQPGVLAHISGMLASRGFNIESLAVARCEQPRMSRMIFVVNGDDNVLEQVRKQLEKIINVVEVHDISRSNFVERDLMLIKVGATPPQRVEIALLVEMFRGKVVDISSGDLVIEIAGHAQKIDAFIELVRPYKILELMRTGSIAVVRTKPRAEGQS